MNRITHKEFLQRLKHSGSTIMKELYSQWKSWLYNEFKAYEHNENLLLIKGKDKAKISTLPKRAIFSPSPASCASLQISWVICTINAIDNALIRVGTYEYKGVSLDISDINDKI